MEHNFETVEEMQRFWFEVKEQLKNNPYSKSFEIDKIEDRTNVILFQKAIIGLNTETLLALGSILNFEIIERIENIEEQYINDETGDLNENEYQEKLAEINEKAIKVMSKFDYDFSKCNLFQILNIEKK